MIDLYTFGTSNGWRASIALEECGLPYVAHKIDITKGEQRGDAYRAINPLGKIPAIIDHDGPGGQTVTLSDSGAILLYCAEKSGRFLPVDPVARIEAIRWVFHSVSDAGEPISNLFRLPRAPDCSEGVLDFCRTRLRTVLEDADRHLADRAYLAGDLSVADLGFFTIAYMGRNMVGADGLPHLTRWLDELSARPAIIRALAVPA